jgi:hypothetical protein
MLELFGYGKNTLDRLLLPEVARWEPEMSRTSHTLHYACRDTIYFVELLGDERADSVCVSATLPQSAMDELSMDPIRKTMVVMQDDGSTRYMDSELELLTDRLTHVYVVTAALTDTSTVDCILEAFVKAIKNGV